MCGSPTVMLNVGFAACSMATEGWAWRARASTPGGATGGGALAPLSEEAPSAERSEVAVEGREAEVGGCRVRVGSSFTGGAG